jgi:hypothetical protein
MKKSTQEAFLWIVNILQNKKIPFRVSGGLAARVYGSKRALGDIDIEIPDKNFGDILDEVKDYMVFGPTRRIIDDAFEVYLLRLNYAGQDIDLCGSESMNVHSKTSDEWLPEETSDFNENLVREIFGVSTPVISKKELVEYKKKISRDIDLEDLSYLNEN